MTYTLDPAWSTLPPVMRIATLLSFRPSAHKIMAALGNGPLCARGLMSALGVVETDADGVIDLAVTLLQLRSNGMIHRQDGP